MSTMPSASLMPMAVPNALVMRNVPKLKIPYVEPMVGIMPMSVF